MDTMARSNILSLFVSLIKWQCGTKMIDIFVLFHMIICCGFGGSNILTCVLGTFVRTHSRVVTIYLKLSVYKIIVVRQMIIVTADKVHL